MKRQPHRRRHELAGRSDPAARATAWASVVLVAVAVAGLVAFPRVEVVWIVLLLFGVAGAGSALFTAAGHVIRGWRDRHR